MGRRLRAIEAIVGDCEVCGVCAGEVVGVEVGQCELAWLETLTDDLRAPRLEIFFSERRIGQSFSST